MVCVADAAVATVDTTRQTEVLTNNHVVDVLVHPVRQQQVVVGDDDHLLLVLLLLLPVAWENHGYYYR